MFSVRSHASFFQLLKLFHGSPSSSLDSFISLCVKKGKESKIEAIYCHFNQGFQMEQISVYVFALSSVTGGFLLKFSRIYYILYFKFSVFSYH